MMKGLKNVIVTDQRAQITFCASCRTCPAIDISKDSNKVIVGGDDEGYTEFTKDQFALFVKTVKEGIYDKYLPTGEILILTNKETEEVIPSDTPEDVWDLIQEHKDEKKDNK